MKKCLPISQGSFPFAGRFSRELCYKDIESIDELYTQLIKEPVFANMNVKKGKYASTLTRKSFIPIGWRITILKMENH